MKDKEEQPFYELKFAEKSSWQEMKSDLKMLFSEIGIRYQFSEKTPVFRVVYESTTINVDVSWAEEGLFFKLHAREIPSADHLEKLSEIYDLLELFGGELVAGSRPEKWQ